MSEDANDAAIQMACRGDSAAAEFLKIMFDVLHFYDDLIDKDHPIADQYVHESMWLVLVSLPRNKFYSAHFAELNPLVCTAIVNWRVANQIERSGASAQLPIAFIIRSSYIDLLIHTATLVGGAEWGVQVAAQARAVWHDEGLDGYQANLIKEKEARDGML